MEVTNWTQELEAEKDLFTRSLRRRKPPSEKATDSKGKLQEAAKAKGKLAVKGVPSRIPVVFLDNQYLPLDSDSDSEYLSDTPQPEREEDMDTHPEVAAVKRRHSFEGPDSQGQKKGERSSCSVRLCLLLLFGVLCIMNLCFELTFLMAMDNLTRGNNQAYINWFKSSFLSANPNLEAYYFAAPIKYRGMCTLWGMFFNLIGIKFLVRSPDLEVRFLLAQLGIFFTMLPLGVCLLICFFVQKWSFPFQTPFSVDNPDLEDRSLLLRLVELCTDEFIGLSVSFWVWLVFFWTPFFVGDPDLEVGSFLPGKNVFLRPIRFVFGIYRMTAVGIMFLWGGYVMAHSIALHIVTCNVNSMKLPGTRRMVIGGLLAVCADIIFIQETRLTSLNLLYKARAEWT
nr:PREDICTED: uncharacterized protein LOC106706629 [Latimeria chalumnae]|eukprot:XP_014353317.1 PREDICTED: uncharacterized protein LOC106706629 [Latimeria chalumnae]